MSFLLGPVGKYLGIALLLFGGLAWVNHIQRDREQLKDALELSRREIAQAKADRDSALGQVRILNEVRATYEPKLEAISKLAGDVRRLSAGVSLCNSTSTFPAESAGAATGSDAAPGSDQPRPAEAVLIDLAADFAERADRTAEQLNALISWLEMTRDAQ